MESESDYGDVTDVEERDDGDDDTELPTDDDRAEDDATTDQQEPDEDAEGADVDADEDTDIEAEEENVGDEEDAGEDEDEDADVNADTAASTAPAATRAPAAVPAAQQQHARDSFIGRTTPQFEDVVVIDREKRRTLDMASLFEFTEAISLRTEQIAAEGFSSSMLRESEIPSDATTARDIAIAEIQMRRCPLKVIRNVGTIVDDKGHAKKCVEIWSMNELILPPFQ